MNTLIRRATFQLLCLALSLLAISPRPGLATDKHTEQKNQTPLQADALVKEVELMPFESVLPSPDGKWVAFAAGDPTKPIQFDYEGQRFTKSGFPMLASALDFSI